MDRLIVNQQDIARWISKQVGPLSLAVAFWGTGAIEHLGLRNCPNSIRVLLDLSSGASNPTEVRELLALFPMQVRAVERLHAKAWIGEGEVLIGSANASANGLGIEGSESQHWCELGLRSANREAVAQAQTWFNQLWEKRSTTIKPDDLDDAQARWELRRSMRPLRQKQGQLLDAVVADPDHFRERRCFVVVSNDDLSEKGEELLATHSRDAGVECYAFEAWRRIPLSATLISFTNYEGRGLEMDEPAIYESAPKLLPGRLQLVYPKKDVLGHKLGRFSEWKKRLERYASRYPRRWKGGDICVELTDFVQGTQP